MNGNQRMSPLTAFFIGLFGVGAVGIGAASAVVLFAMGIVNDKAGTLLEFADDTVAGLPKLLDSLPSAVEELLDDRRAPEYASQIEVDVSFVVDSRYGSIRPAVTIVNSGEEAVSLLALRVVALDANGVPVDEWTEVAATPIALDNSWRGPLLGGATRHILMSNRRNGRGLTDTAGITGAIEIVDVRIWQQ